MSDGRGLFLGVETVRTAVRQVREANVFLVFVVLDNPVTKVRIVSDGWGLFLEGVETVKDGVRWEGLVSIGGGDSEDSCEGNVFLVFLVLDNPVNKVMTFA